MDRQNAFIKATSRITIFNLTNIDKIQRTKEGSYLSIRKWLQKAKKKLGEPLLHSITRWKSEEETYLLFNTADYSEVHGFVKDTKEHASKVFNDTIKEKASTKKYEDSYNISTSQRSYMAALSASSLSQPWQQNKPQSPSEGNRGNKRRKPLVYGLASQEPKEVIPELNRTKEKSSLK